MANSSLGQLHAAYTRQVQGSARKLSDKRHNKPLHVIAKVSKQVYPRGKAIDRMLSLDGYQQGDVNGE